MTSIEDVKTVLNKFFGDTSRSQGETREGLEELQDEIQTMLDALEEDL